MPKTGQRSQSDLDALGEALVKARVLEQEIRVAFADQPMPRSDHIAHPGTWFDEHGTMHTYENPEAITIAQFLTGKRWNDLVGMPLIAWNDANSCLTFVTNAASVYYLPAFMLTAIYHYNEAQMQVEGSLFNKLTHPIRAKEMFEGALDRLPEEIPEVSKPRYRSAAQQEALEAHGIQEFEEFVQLLSPAQRRRIQHFLRFMAETYPGAHDEIVTRALQGYWDTASE